MEPRDLEAWVRQQCGQYRFDAAGVFHRNSDRASWPLHAEGAEELENKLACGGHLLPLPKEPAALANVLEVSIVNFLVTRAEALAEAEVRRGTERGYPDLEFGGQAFGGGFHAVDVKAARRAASGKRTQSRITLYTGNTYFKWPDLPWPGTFRPFNDYATHIDVLMIYNLNTETAGRVEDLEVLVQQPWRIASRQRSSTTREYIGAVDSLNALREGRGEFDTPDEFYRFWRAYPFRVSAQVQNQLQRALAQRDAELRRLRGGQGSEP